MSKQTLVGLIRQVTGYKGYLQYGRGMEWIVLCRGARKEYGEVNRKLKAAFETWMRVDVSKTYTLTMYFFIIRDDKGKLLGTAHTFKETGTRERNVLVDYNRGVWETDLESTHKYNARKDADSQKVTYKQISKGKVK